MPEKVKRWITGLGSKVAKRLRKKEPDETGKIFYGVGILLIGLGVLAAAIAFFFSLLEEPVTSLERPPFGETKKITLEASDGTRRELVEFELSGILPDRETMDVLFERAMERGKEAWLGANTDYRHITTSLDFYTEDEDGIHYAFRSHDITILSNYGILMTDEIPPEGLSTEFDVTLSYKDYAKVYTIPVTVLPYRAAGSFAEDLQELLAKKNEEDASSQELALPDQYGDETLVFTEEKRNPATVFLIFLLLAVGCFLLPDELKKRRKEKREQELNQNYAAIVTKLNLLIQANLSTRSAWERIVREYTEKKTSPVAPYEEMVLTWREIQSGTAEEKAYEDYGIRCQLRSYMRLGNLLSQNMRQGISGLKASLWEEAENAWEERKNLAIREGEKAGTKILFPMLLLLGIVLAILIVPAFMSF